MKSTFELTQRQVREREYYDSYSKKAEQPEVYFEPVLGRIKQPGNSYWHVAELAKRYFTSPDQRLLDFGCGTGYYAMQYARIGYQVYGFDISPNNVTCASQLAQKHHCEDTTHFSVGIAEALQYPDAWFDIVIGIDILHHVEVGPAVAECSRVLKPGGVAIFHEPVRAPVYEALRDSRLGTWLVPKTASLERHITEDERKLGPADITALRSFDGKLDMTHFLLLSRLSKFFPGTLTSLEVADQALFRAVPFLRRFAGRVVLTLQK